LSIVIKKRKRAVNVVYKVLEVKILILFLAVPGDGTQNHEGIRQVLYHSTTSPAPENLVLNTVLPLMI
jgi:hypothetical protein